MRPPESIDDRRVLILFFVRMLVVVAVGAGPPKRTALDRECRPQGHDELEGSGGGIGLVREVTVKEARDRKHAEEVEAHRGPDGDGAGPDPDDAEAGEV